MMDREEKAQLEKERLEKSRLYELQMLQCFFDQLAISRYSHATEVKAISTALNADKINFESLRAKAFAIYKEEGNGNQIYDEAFYYALFAFLLMLTKYAPLNLECVIMLTSIEEEYRILTPSGHQYDGMHKGVRDFLIDRDKKHPTTREDKLEREIAYSKERVATIEDKLELDREIKYLKEQIAAIENKSDREIAYSKERIAAIESKDISKPEIFCPVNTSRNITNANRRIATTTGGVIGFLLGVVGVILFSILAPHALVGAAAVIAFLGGPCIIGAAIGRISPLIRNCFSPPSVPGKPSSPISDKTREVFSRFENNAKNLVSDQPIQEISSASSHGLVGARLSLSRDNSRAHSVPSLKPGQVNAEPVSSFSPTFHGYSQQTPRESSHSSVEADTDRATERAGLR